MSKRRKRPTLFMFKRNGKELNRAPNLSSYLSDLNLTEGDREYAEVTAPGYFEMPVDPMIIDTHSTDWRELLDGGTNQQLLGLLKDAIKYADFTERQRQVLDCYLQEMNCGDIAKKLGICQTNVTKTLYGCDYKKKNENVWRYNQGGILNKIKKYIEERLKETQQDEI